MAIRNIASLLILISLPLCLAYPFQDVTEQAGLYQPLGKWKKYGGPGIADLDGDGYPDLLLGHHGPKRIQLFFNNGNGTFSLSKFYKSGDTHGLNPIRLTPFDRYMHFILSRGGSVGRKPQPPHVFRITADRDKVITETERSPDFGHTRGPGRTVIFMSLRTNTTRRQRPDALMLNGVYVRYRDRHYMLRVGPDRTFYHRPTESEVVTTRFIGFASVTDIDNDGDMEVIMFASLSVWKLTKAFVLTDISKSVLPATADKELISVNSMAEFDYDNDGDWDIIVTQAAKTNMGWRINHFPRHTKLLRNDNGKYHDATLGAGIPSYGKASETVGVTVGDFDNDGCIDIFIVRYYDSPAMILLKNNCNGTFTEVSHGLKREPGVPGAMVTAVDYDLDGRVDLVVAEGDWKDIKKGGKYRLMRNVMNTNGNGFILVRVRNAPGFRCTSLHAVVTVMTEDGVKMMRRVGSSGTAVSVSYIETVHFGIGGRASVRYVTVRWVDGTTSWRRDIAANSTLSFGVGY